MKPWGGAVVEGLGRVVPGLAQSSRSVAKRRAAGVAAYVGANGAGKSLLAALDTVPTLRGIPWSCANPDHFHTAQGITSGVRKVLSTMRFVTPSGADHPLWVPLDDYVKILTAEHCDLILDEVGGAAGSASGGDDLPMPVKASLQELRRRDVLCRHTAPGWMRATKTLREVTQTVTLVMGFMPEVARFPVVVHGPHTVEVFDAERERLVEVSCDVEGEHEHDSGRLWSARRLMYARTFDANTFDEWTTAKRERLRPLVRQLFWRPGSEAERVYDTYAYVEKLGQVTDAGVCLDCGGYRARRKCTCESPTVRRRRVQPVGTSSVSAPAA